MDTIDEPKKFLDFEYDRKRQKTRREIFLETMERVGVVDKAVLSEWKEKAYSSNSP